MTVRLPQTVEDAIESLGPNWSEERRQQLRQSLLETAARAGAQALTAREQQARLAQQTRDALNDRIQAQVLREQQEISEQVSISAASGWPMRASPPDDFFVVPPSSGYLSRGLDGMGNSIPGGVLRAGNFSVQVITSTVVNRNPVPARGNRAYNPELPSYDPPAEDEE